MMIGLGLITPEINRLDLNDCAGCMRGLAGPADVLLAVRQKIASGSGYLAVSSLRLPDYITISDAERRAVNDALFELDSPTFFSTTSIYNGQTVVGNPTPISELRAQIDAALRKTGITPPSTRPKWLIPVAVGAGALLLGGIVFAVVRRK